MLTQAKIIRKKIMSEYLKFEKSQDEFFNKGMTVRDFLLDYYMEGKDPIGFGSLFTDYYYILRMFRKFGDKNKGSCIGNKHSDHIVFYAGRMHADLLVNFIETFFGPEAIRCFLSSQDYKVSSLENWSKSKEGQHIISFKHHMFENRGDYKSFSDFLSWPT